jgi:hypothetical protein
MTFKENKYFNYVYFSPKCVIDHIPEKVIAVVLLKVFAKALLYSFHFVKSSVFAKVSASSASKIVFFSMS